MELHARLREEATSRERCPYCHDALGADALHDERIECPGCATTHHRACIAELGRCTIRGCERPLTVPAEAPLEDTGRRSAIAREVRRRIRERVRTFVRNNARAADEPGDLVERYDAAVRQGELAEAERDLESAAEWFHEVARMERTARPGELARARRRCNPDALASYASRLERTASTRSTLVIMAKLAVALGVVFGAALIALSLA